MHRRVGLSVRPACVHTALECRDQRSSCSDSVFSSLTAGMYFLSDYLNPLSSRSVAATVAHREISPHSRAKVTSRRRGWQKSPAGYAGRVGHHGHMAASGDLLGAAPGARGAAGLIPSPNAPKTVAACRSRLSLQSTAIYSPPRLTWDVREACEACRLELCGHCLSHTAQHGLAATKDMVARAANKQTLRFPRSRPRRKRWWARAASKQTLKVPPKLV